MSRAPPDPIFSLRGHIGSITNVNFTNEIFPPTLNLLSSSSSGEIFLWDLETFRVRNKCLGHSGRDVLWTDCCEERIYSQGRDGNICIWKIENERWTQISSRSQNAIGFCKCSLHKGSGTLLLACPTSEMSTTEVLNVETMQTLISTHNLLHDHQKYGMCMASKLFTFPNSGKVMLTCGFENGRVVLFCVDDGCVVSELKCSDNPIMCLDIDAEHRQKGVAGSPDNEITVWGCSEPTRIDVTQRVKVTNPGINSLAIRKDGKIMCTGGQDFRIRVFSWKNMRSLAVLDHHDDQVLCVNFSKSKDSTGKFLFAAGSKDKKISLWSLYNS